MWGFMGGRGGLPDKFEEQYHCYSAAMADKTHLEVSRCRFGYPFLPPMISCSWHAMNHDRIDLNTPH